MPRSGNRCCVMYIESFSCLAILLNLVWKTRRTDMLLPVCQWSFLSAVWTHCIGRIISPPFLPYYSLCSINTPLLYMKAPVRSIKNIAYSIFLKHAVSLYNLFPIYDK